MGELLKSALQHQGGRPSGNGIGRIPFLSDLGVSKIESSNAQRFHALPEDLKAAVIEGRMLTPRRQSHRMPRERVRVAPRCAGTKQARQTDVEIPGVEAVTNL